MDCNDCVERLYVFLDLELAAVRLRATRLGQEVHGPSELPGRHVGPLMGDELLPVEAPDRL